MSVLRFLLVLMPCVLATALPVSEAQAAGPIRRCMGADGVSVFTDKPCDLLQARPRVVTAPSSAPASAGTGRAGLGARTGLQCPQRLSELVDEIRIAIQSSDINRLAALYWWGGQGNAQASRLLERLEGMVARPLIDIAPVYPAPPSPPDPVTAAEWIDVPARSDEDERTLAMQAVTDSQMPTMRRQRPYALRIEQSLANSGTPSRQILHLRRQYGCFWINF